jgi:hypothetical protein
MPIPEFNRLWTFTSTGAGTWENAQTAQNITFVLETAPGSTATVLLQHRRSGSTLVTQFSSVNMGAAESTSFSYSGAYFEIRPRVTDKTSTGTVYVQGIGN